jgi:hypothetical protein
LTFHPDNMKITTMNDFETKIEIQNYIKKFIERRKEDYEYNLNAHFKMKSSNFSSEVSETLAKILIKERDILIDFPYPIYSVTRPKENGDTNDILINDEYIVEVKGTTSSDGLITLSKNNLNCYAWVWLDFNRVVDEVSSFVTIHVVKRPSMNITPKIIKTNNEKKLNFKKLCRDIRHGEDYQKLEYNVWEYKLCKKGDTYNEFFVVE